MALVSSSRSKFFTSYALQKEAHGDDENRPKKWADNDRLNQTIKATTGDLRCLVVLS